MDLGKKRPFRHLGRIVDITNVILSVVVVISAIFVAIDTEKNMLLFPVIFLCTGLINLALAIKSRKRNELLRFIVQMVAFALFMAIGILSLAVVLGR